MRNVDRVRADDQDSAQTLERASDSVDADLHTIRLPANQDPVRGGLPTNESAELTVSGSLHARTLPVHVANRNLSKPYRLFKEFAAQMSPKLFPDLPA